MSKDMPAWFNRAMGGRCDRPARAEGGRTPQWTGEGDSGKPMKEKSSDLNKDASSAAGDSVLHGGLALASGLGAALGRGKIRGVGALGALANGAATSMAINRSRRLSDEAKEASKAGDEAEGRAKGGTVKKRSKR